jgi:starch phosphorylase
MVRDYSNRYYVPAARNFKHLTENFAEKARELAQIQARLISLWHVIVISPPTLATDPDFLVGDTFRVTLKVFLGELSPEEVAVQVYHGKLRASDEFEESRGENMRLQETLSPGVYLYACTITCSDSGRFGYTARVIPGGDEVLSHTPGLITWVNGENPMPA